MTTRELREAHALSTLAARQHYPAFARLAFTRATGETLMPNWHLDAISHMLQGVADGTIKRLIISMPPRFGKSYMSSIAFPAWLLGRDPRQKIICASYSQPLSNDFSRSMRELMKSQWYRGVFPQTVLDRNRSSLEEMGTTRGGYRLSTSVGGALTGRGGNVIIIDDPMKAGDAQSETVRASVRDWYNSVVSSRLNNPKQGAIIVVAQRLHMDDLPGHLLDAGGWEHLVLPMIEWQQRTVPLVPGVTGNRAPGRLLHEERIGLPEVERIRAEMGERDFEAQYNQRPLPPGGALFKAQWLKRYDAPLQPHQYLGVFQSWDTAYEVNADNDYSACTTWGVTPDCRFHLLDVFRDRLPFDQLQRKLIDHRKRWNAGLVIVEKQGAGISLWQNIALGCDQHWLKPLIPQNSKQHRASQQTPRFERGEIYLPREAPWLDAFEKELLSFPHYRHDDQVDSAVQFLAAFAQRDLKGLADISRHFTSNYSW